MHSPFSRLFKSLKFKIYKPDNDSLLIWRFCINLYTSTFYFILLSSHFLFLFSLWHDVLYFSFSLYFLLFQNDWKIRFVLICFIIVYEHPLVKENKNLYWYVSIIIYQHLLVKEEKKSCRYNSTIILWTPFS